MTMAP
jgi:hypothetical protein